MIKQGCASYSDEATLRKRVDVQPEITLASSQWLENVMGMSVTFKVNSVTTEWQIGCDTCAVE